MCSTNCCCSCAWLPFAWFSWEHPPNHRLQAFQSFRWIPHPKYVQEQNIKDKRKGRFLLHLEHNRCICFFFHSTLGMLACFPMEMENGISNTHLLQEADWINLPPSSNLSSTVPMYTPTPTLDYQQHIPCISDIVSIATVFCWSSLGGMLYCMQHNSSSSGVRWPAGGIKIEFDLLQQLKRFCPANC